MASKTVKHDCFLDQIGLIHKLWPLNFFQDSMAQDLSCQVCLNGRRRAGRVKENPSSSGLTMLAKAPKLDNLSKIGRELNPRPIFDNLSKIGMSSKNTVCYRVGSYYDEEFRRRLTRKMLALPRQHYAIYMQTSSSDDGL